jgi:REP element-mobilizing transposase RayT
LARAVQLTKVREEAMLAKKRQEIIQKAMDVAENKGRNIQQMME